MSWGVRFFAANDGYKCVLSVQEFELITQPTHFGLQIPQMNAFLLITVFNGYLLLTAAGK